MATNFIQNGDRVTVTTAAAVSSGELVRVGNIIGVAIADAAANEDVVLAIGGVWRLSKTSALAIAVGDPVYAIAASNVISKTASANYYVGVAVEAAANPSDTVKVRLNPSLPKATG